VCVGQPVAQKSMEIMGAQLFWLFDILPEEGDDLSQYDMLAGTPHLTSYPLPFKCQLVPRSPERVQVAEREVAEVDSVTYQLTL
jgi:hypothetical protein